MGGRGSVSGAGRGGAGGGGGGGLNIVGEASLISARNEGFRQEADDTLRVLRDINRQYGINVDDAVIVDIKGAGKNSVMAYMSHGGELGVNRVFFNDKQMTQAYDECVAAGFHPSRGNKSAMEAVVSHEMGHRLALVAGQRNGTDIYTASDTIVKRAANNLGITPKKLRTAISGYAAENHAETVAEAFSDVYCNGSKAHRNSRAVVFEMNRILQNGDRL